MEKRPRTLFYLAECEERAGRIATAALHYDEYLDLFERLSPPEQKDEADRQKLAVARRDALDADIPRVTFRLPATVPAGTKVTRSSKASPDPVPVRVGVLLPIDPGEHWVRTEAPGAPARDKRFFVNKRQRLTVELTVAEAGEERKTVRYSAPTEPVPSVQTPPLDGGTEGRRTIMWISGCVGVVGVAGGITAGALTWSQKGILESNCRGGVCNKKGESAADFAGVMSPLSTVSFTVGAVGLGVWAFLYLTQPETARVGRNQGPQLGSLPEPALRVGLQGRETVVESRWAW
ncbi:hypothetical protein [Sorangium sp. So ce388]|uniref:hypothetical protein n=1 Tax=Sorangium sp. So ce388 TaxID=3133309 RepID=UPI003F5BDA9E